MECKSIRFVANRVPAKLRSPIETFFYCFHSIQNARRLECFSLCFIYNVLFPVYFIDALQNFIETIRFKVDVDVNIFLTQFLGDRKSHGYWLNQIQKQSNHYEHIIFNYFGDEEKNRVDLLSVMKVEFVCNVENEISKFKLANTAIEKIKQIYQKFPCLCLPFVCAANWKYHYYYLLGLERFRVFSLLFLLFLNKISSYFRIQKF